MVQKEESDPLDRSEYLLRQYCRNMGSLHANPSEILRHFQKPNPINTLTPNFKMLPVENRLEKLWREQHFGAAEPFAPEGHDHTFFY